jgi:hypothetical protein
VWNFEHVVLTKESTDGDNRTNHEDMKWLLLVSVVNIGRDKVQPQGIDAMVFRASCCRLMLVPLHDFAYTTLMSLF